MSNDFRRYMHVEKFGSSETDGINQGVCYISYKIDGTNGCIWYDNDIGTIRFGSRNRELSDETKDTDNQGFVKLMKSKEYENEYLDFLNFLCRHRSLIIYGEWLVCSTLKTYKDDAWKHFYVFDVYDRDTDSYWSYDDYKKVFDEDYPYIKYIPCIAKLTNPTEEELKGCLDYTGDWLIKDGLGEGIVIKNYQYRNRYGRQTWAKMLTEDYKKHKSSSRHENKVLKEDHNTEYEIIKLMTYEHIMKERNKVMELHNSDTFEAKFIPETLNRAYNEFIKDNLEIIVLKKFKNATINFAVLKKLSDQRVKEVIL